MNDNRSMSVTTALNFILTYCLVRFGLVFTANMSVFGIMLVFVIGAGLVGIYALLNQKYATQLLQLNFCFLVFNIFWLIILQRFMPNSYAVSTTDTYVKQLMILLLLWGFYLYMQHIPARSRRLLVSIYLWTITVSAMYTLYVALTGGEGIIRNTAFGEYDSNFRLMYGGFDFIYGLVVVYVTVLVILAKGRDRIKRSSKVWMLGLMALIAVTIIASSYSTAFSLILIFTIFVAPKMFKTKILLICLLVFFVYVIPRPLTQLIDAIPFMPELTATRVNDVILSFSGQSTSSYLSDEGQRLDRVYWSLKTFGEHPMLGAFVEKGKMILGGHTEWIDQIARYGIIAGISNALFWGSSYRKIVSSTDDDLARKSLKSAFLVYFILGFLNPISMVVTSAPLFVFCPFAKELFVRSK